MKRADFSLKDGRIEFHAEAEERLTAQQKYQIILCGIGGTVLVVLVKIIGLWALGAALLAGLFGALFHDFA